MWTPLQGVVLFLCFGMQSVCASSDKGEACLYNVSTPAWFIEKIPSKVLPLQERSSFSFSVTTCNDAHVILSSGEDLHISESYEIVIGGWGNTKSVIRFGVQPARPPLYENFHNPLNCNESRSFYVSWENETLKVGAVSSTALSGGAGQTGETTDTSDNATFADDVVEDGSRWEDPFLTYTETSRNVTIRHVFVHNFYGRGAEWRIDVPCDTSPTQTPDTEDDVDCVQTPLTTDEVSDGVSQGHLVGAVIVALLFGLAGGFCAAYFGPRLWRKWREKRGAQQKKEEARDIEELTGLVTEATPPRDKAQDKDAPIPKPPADMLPDTPASAAGKKPANTYTPYLSMSGGPDARKSDDATARDVNKPNVPRKPSNVSARVQAPLPEVPSGAGVTSQKPTSQGKGMGGKGRKEEEAEPPQEIYANQDAHVYEGVRHELPIYENREARMYESLKVPAKKKPGK